MGTMNNTSQNLKDSRWASSGSFRSTHGSSTAYTSSYKSTPTPSLTPGFNSTATPNSISKWATSRGSPSPNRYQIRPTDSVPAAAAATRTESATPSLDSQNRQQPRQQPTPLQRAFLRRQQCYNTFNKLLRRLKWKSATLLLSYNRTLALIHSNTTGHTDTSVPTETTSSSLLSPIFEKDHEPETMFKIDFFEFYVLLERTLVSLLSCFGVEVSAMHAADLSSVDGDGNRQQHLTNGVTESTQEASNGLIGNSKVLMPKSQQNYIHSYHANVLSALDSTSNPLHTALGVGDVRNYLGIAKAWRNKWKDAEEKIKDEREDGLVGSMYEALLKDLRLEAMLGSILVGVVEGGVLAEREITRLVAEVSASAEGLIDVDMDLDLDVVLDNKASESDNTGPVQTTIPSAVVLGQGPMEAVDDMMDCD